MEPKKRSPKEPGSDADEEYSIPRDQDGETGWDDCEDDANDHLPRPLIIAAIVFSSIVAWLIIWAIIG